MPDTITEITCEDGTWRALYFDGELVFEGDKLTMNQLCELLDVEYIVRLRPLRFF